MLKYITSMEEHFFKNALTERHLGYSYFTFRNRHLVDQYTFAFSPKIYVILLNCNTSLMSPTAQSVVQSLLSG